ncbi:NYN domain-containing protein [Balneolales bacterium ANBcel1]|nr:NYN domain-containing protein [Balneolales bacterium ANBcel1]
MSKYGIYVDAVSVTMNGGYGLRYDILRKFAGRDGSHAARLNVYLAYDRSRAREDDNYQAKTTRFCEVLRDFQYKVIERPVDRLIDPDTGEVVSQGAVDVDMAVDIVSQAETMDRIVILTHNEKFMRLVNALQDKGCRVELIGFDNMDSTLKRQADLYVSGYVIPGLLPIKSPYEWGSVGSRVRGVCYDFSHSDGYGFMRYLAKINDKLWITDSRSPDSPYRTVFAHVSQFEADFDTSFLPSRELIFEFDLVENDKGLVAQNIVLVSAP